METKLEETKIPEPMTQERIQALIESRQPKQRQATWRPTAGGILGIIAGYANILLGATALFGGLAGITILGLPAITSGVGIGLGVALVVLGAVSILGGSFGVARRAYPMAMIGSITAMFPSPAALAGAFSLVFNGLGRNEFHQH